MRESDSALKEEGFELVVPLEKSRLSQTRHSDSDSFGG